MVKSLFLRGEKKAKRKLKPEGNASLVGILQHPDGTVLKQLQPPPRGPREQEFYNKVRVPQCGGGWNEGCASLSLQLGKCSVNQLP